MRRMGAALAAVALSMTTLAACSGGGDEAYCAEIKSGEKEFSDTFANVGQDMGKMNAAMAKLDEKIGELVAVAPDEVKGDWETVQSGVQKVMPALEKLKDVDVTDPSSMEDPELMKELETFSTDMQALQTDMTKSMDAIDKDSKERCGTTMSG